MSTAKTSKWKEMATAMYNQAQENKKNPNKKNQATTTSNGQQPKSGSTAVAAPGFAARRNFTPPAVAPKALTDFGWSDVLYLGKTTGKVQLIPLRNQNNQTLCLKLTGGGTIPMNIGLSVTEYGKTKLTFTCNAQAERETLERMHVDATDSCMMFVKEWYPNYTGDIDASKLVSRLISEVKPKNDGGEWAQLVSANIAENDLYSSDSRKDPDLIITNNEGKAIMNLPDVLGQKWTSLTIEFQFLCLGMTKEEKDKPSRPIISISKRVRRLCVEPDESQHHYVLPENQEAHDASGCKLLHCQILPVRVATLKDHMLISNLVQRDQAQVAFVSNRAGGNFIIKLTGGGVLPPFVFEANRDGKFQITVSIDSLEEEKCLDGLTNELKTHAVTNRDVYFPKSEDEDKALLKFVKRILARKSDKPEHASYSRSLQCIVDVEKFATGEVRIVDETGQFVQFHGPADIQCLKGKRWQELWIELRCVYHQTKSAGETWEVGFSKRFIYMKLQPEYRLDDNPFPVQPAGTAVVAQEAVAEPAPKKARNA